MGFIESMLLRMLIGTYRFPFVRLPRLILRWVRFSAPFIFSCFKIFFLATILAIIVATPAAFAYFFDDANSWLRSRISTDGSDLITKYKLPVQITGFGLSSVFAIGAIWGLIYVKRKLRQRKAAIAEKRFPPIHPPVQFPRSGATS